MEASVLRRDTIVTRGEYQQKIPQNKAIMQSTVQKKVTDLQKKIRESTQVSFKYLNTWQLILSKNTKKIVTLKLPIEFFC
jgi:hypothetical protein